MDENKRLNRQTLLPPPEDQAQGKLLELFDLLLESDAGDAEGDSPACPLREDVPHPILPPEELRAYFPMLQERGIQMPCILPPLDKKP